MVTSMSAFLGRITTESSCLGRRAVDSDARRVLRELRLELGHLRLDELDVLLGALDVVVLLDDATRAARGRRQRAGRDGLAPEEAAEDGARDRHRGLQARAALLVLLAVDGLLRRVQLRLELRDLGVVLRAQLLALRVAALARTLREPRAEIGLRLARARDELLRRAAPERHRLCLVEPVGVVLRPALVALRVARGRGQLVERRALARGRLEIGEGDCQIGRAGPVDRDRTVGECCEPRVVDGLVDLVLGVQQAYVRAADEHRQIRERRTRRRRAAQRHVGGLDAGGRRRGRGRSTLGDRSGGSRGTGNRRGGHRGRGRRRRPGRLEGRHQRGDLRPRERPAQVRHRPARLEHHRRVLVHVVEQEHAAAECREQLLERRAIEPALTRGALEPVQHPLLVLVGLEAADQPRPGVREALVVEVDGVLGGEQHAHAERARLLQQSEERFLRRRLPDRREVSEDLVHVDERTQAGRARLPPHPGQDGVQEQRHEEHPLGVREVRDREDRDARLACITAQEAADVERRALHPELEARRGEQVVERQRELEAVLLRVERVEVEHADLGERRLLDLRDQRGDVERSGRWPRPRRGDSRAGCARGS